jgi:hypothetical protein
MPIKELSWQPRQATTRCYTRQRRYRDAYPTHFAVDRAPVQGRFGEPSNRHATVGNPPITRWDYPQFSVYFEHDRVLHTVLLKSAPAG